MTAMQEAFRTTLESRGAEPALATPERQWTFQQLNAAANALAHHLSHDLGITAGQHVPLLFHRSALLVILQLALVKLGAVAAPIDANSPSSRQRLMLKRLRCELVLHAPDVDVGALSREGFRTAAISSQLAEPQAGAPEVWQGFPPSTEGTAFVMFTSGSTGEPKGVQIPADGIVMLSRNQGAINLQPGMRWAFLASPAFDMALLEVWACLLSGGCCVVLEHKSPSLEDISDFLRTQDVRHAGLTTSVFNAMAQDTPEAFDHMSQVIIGGEAATPGPIRLALQRCPQLRVVNGYGPTENSVFSVVHDVALAELSDGAVVPIGQALPGVLTRLVPHGEPDGADTVIEQELWLGGPGLSRGYINDAERTAASFVTDTQGQRWYRTGDLVRQDAEGRFVFVGRADRQVKVHGQRIELDEVELHARACPGVAEAMATLLGESSEDFRVALAYAGAPNNRPDPHQLRNFLNDRLPLSGVPSLCLPMEALPKLPNGKVDRKRLHGLLRGDHMPGRLIDVLHEALRTHADQPCLQVKAGTLTYAEVDRRSEVLAQALKARGLQAGDFVPLLLPRSAELVVAMLAVIRCGASYVPIDLRSPPARIALVIGRVKPRLALLLQDAEIDGLTPQHKVVLDTFDWQQAIDTPVPWPDTPPDTPLYVMFTSGSTGVPKGVAVSHDNLAALFLDQTWADFSPGARWLLATSPAFDISAIEIWGALLFGASLHILEGELPDLDEISQLVVQHRITHVQLAAALFNALVDTHLEALSGVLQFITGGERASPAHMRKVLSAYPGMRLLNAYGPTETTVWSSIRRVELADTQRPNGIPIGEPIRGTQLKLLPLKPDEPESHCELLIGGAGVAIGYLGDPEQTARRFIELDGQRWYRTGDLAQYAPDGCLEYLGRADRQIKLQGQRFELDDIELTLASCLPGGDVVALLQGPTPEEKRLVAAYICDPAQPINPEELARLARQRLPMAAVPSRLLRLDSFPANLNGKVDREALARLLESPAQAGAAVDQAVDQSWASPFEAMLAQAWAELLPRAAPHRAANFLADGGSSILALKLAARVSQVAQRQFAPSEVMLHPGFVELAARIASAPLQSQAAVGAIHHQDRAWVQLSRVQTNLLRAHQLDPLGQAYLLHQAWHLSDGTAPEALERAFIELKRRHPMLRLRMAPLGLAWQAWVDDTLPAGWWTLHTQAVPCPSDLAWPSTVKQAISRPLDLSEMGAMRVDLWPTEAGGLLVVWTVHHAVADESAFEQAEAELSALLKGQALPPVEGSGVDMAATEAQWIDHEGLAHTARQLRADLHGLPLALPRPPSAGAMVFIDPGQDVTSALQAWSLDHGHKTFPLLAAAWGLTLQGTFGAAHRHVVTPFSRRLEAKLIEPFNYWLDLRVIDMGRQPGEGAAPHLERVRQSLLEAQTRSFQPLDLLLEALGDSSAASHVGQFGLTWRKAGPARAARLTPQAQAIEPPQDVARQGLSLHVTQQGEQWLWMVETTVTDGLPALADRLAQALGRALMELLALPADTTGATPPPAAVAPAPQTFAPASANDTTPALAQAWCRWTGATPHTPAPDSRFFESGGTSLTAMRMASALTKEHGLSFAVCEFLQEPTFGRLQAIVRHKHRPLPDHTTWLGPLDATEVLVLLPGAGGQAVGMMPLAQAMLDTHGPNRAMAIVDLDGLIASGPSEGMLAHVLTHLDHLLTQTIGAPRLQAIVGYSLGGTLAMAWTRHHKADTALVLLDSFEERAFQNGLLRRIERKLSRKLHRSPGKNTPHLEEGQDHLEDGLAQVVHRASRGQWQALHRQLSFEAQQAPHSRAFLIQSDESVRFHGLLWRRHSNGYDPKGFSQWTQAEISCSHLDLIHRKSTLVSHWIKGFLS